MSEECPDAKPQEFLHERSLSLAVDMQDRVNDYISSSIDLLKTEDSTRASRKHWNKLSDELLDMLGEAIDMIEAANVG